MIQTHLHNPAIFFAAKTRHAFQANRVIKIAIRNPEKLGSSERRSWANETLSCQRTTV